MISVISKNDVDVSRFENEYVEYHINMDGCELFVDLWGDFFEDISPNSDIRDVEMWVYSKPYNQIVDKSYADNYYVDIDLTQKTRIIEELLKYELKGMSIYA